MYSWKKCLQVLAWAQSFCSQSSGVGNWVGTPFLPHFHGANASSQAILAVCGPNVLFLLRPDSSLLPNSLSLVSWTKFSLCFSPLLLLMFVGFFLIVSCHIAVVFAHRAHYNNTHMVEWLNPLVYRIQNNAEAYMMYKNWVVLIKAHSWKHPGQQLSTEPRLWCFPQGCAVCPAPCIAW